MTVDVKLDYLAEVVLVTRLRYKVTLIFPFSYCTLWEGVIMHTKCKFYIYVFNSYSFLNLQNVRYSQPFVSMVLRP